ncbi:MAG: hypothetical protein K2F99_00945 [Muribaculaceae bacterium]|nr:hypothetical protein [Muribaculaceae bacterium]
MEQIMFDSTWSFRIKTTVYLTNRESPVIYYPATMEKYTDAAVKAAYKDGVDRVIAGMSTSGVFMLGPNVIRSKDVQSCQVRVEMLNEMNRNQQQKNNEYALTLTDVLAAWYVDTYLTPDQKE